MTTKNQDQQQIAVQEPPSVGIMLHEMLKNIQAGQVTSQSVEVLKGMMDLYERSEARQAEKDFAEAFAKMQSEIRRVQATHAVPAKDGTIKYHVAKFEEVWDEVEPRLKQYGFTAGFSQKYEEGLPLRVTETFILQHTKSGHKTMTPFTVRVGNGPPGCVDYQADGAASSYAKMRAFCSCLNIIIQADDDARMLGKPIGKALAEDLEARCKKAGVDIELFLKFAGAANFESIADNRYEAINEQLEKKERGAGKKEDKEHVW